MRKRIIFFATKNDMIAIFNMFCELVSFEIRIVAINEMSNSINVYYSIEELPHLGQLHSNNHCSENYIILKSDIPIEVNNNIIDNRTCIFFSPSGFSPDEECLIHGQFAMMDENDTSKELMKAMNKVLKKCCKCVRGWYIGNEATQLQGIKRFITIGVNEPPEYDFTF